MDGKVIVVTGALGALGRVVVDSALARGARVASVDHAPTQVPATSNQFELGGVDLTDATAAKKAIDAAVSHFGRLDALINVAPPDPTRYLIAVRDGGVAVSVTSPAEAERGIRSQRVGVNVDREGLETVARLAEEGVLTTRVAATFPAASAADAYRADASDGRIVLTF